MILDVGCGNDSSGDVNLDLFKKNSPHNSGRSVDLSKTKNFVIGDVNHLPFKERAFAESICNQVLEHKGVRPKIALAELLRVTRNKVTITVPHYTQVFLQKYFFPQHCHVNVMTKSFFHNELKMFPHEVRNIKWRFIPTRWGKLPIYAPNGLQITVFIKKTE